MQRGSVQKYGAKWRSTVAALVTVACAVATLAATGSGSGAATKLIAKAAGTPIKLGVVTTLQSTTVSTYPETVAGAKAAVLHINANGGIDGHPVALDVCDDQGSPNQAEVCARQFVANGDVASVADTSIWGGSIVPILQSAHIADIGANPNNQANWTNPISFPFGANGAAGAFPACVYALKESGAKSFSGVVLSGFGGSEVSQLQAAAKGAGIKYAGTVNIPLTSSDFSTYAEQVGEQNSQGTVMVLTNSGVVGMLRSMHQQALNVRSCVGSGSLSPQQLTALGPIANGLFITAATGSPQGKTNAGINAFNSQMNAAKKAGVANASVRDELSLNAWLSVYAIQDLAEKISGAITNTAIMNAADTSNNINLEHVLNWTPSQTGPSPYVRIPNGMMYVGTMKNGILVNTKYPPVDVYKLQGLGK